MKEILSPILLIFLSVTLASSESQHSVNHNVLVDMDQLYYLQGEQTPYTGKVYTLFANGTDTLSIVSMVDGQYDGAYRSFYQGGMLASEIQYQHGKRHGAFTTLHPNGQVSEEGAFNNDWREGAHTYYSMDGSVVSQTTYTADGGEIE